MSNNNPMNGMFVIELSPKRDGGGGRSKMVEIDVDEECDGRLDLMSATEYSS